MIKKWNGSVFFSDKKFESQRNDPQVKPVGFPFYIHFSILFRDLHFYIRWTILCCLLSRQFYGDSESIVIPRLDDLLWRLSESNFWFLAPCDQHVPNNGITTMKKISLAKMSHWRKARKRLLRILFMIKGFFSTVFIHLGVILFVITSQN